MGLGRIGRWDGCLVVAVCVLGLRQWSLLLPYPQGKEEPLEAGDSGCWAGKC